MGADKSAENTPNAPKFVCPSPKVCDFNEKRLHWVFVVREINHSKLFYEYHFFDLLFPGPFFSWASVPMGIRSPSQNVHVFDTTLVCKLLASTQLQRRSGQEIFSLLPIKGLALQHCQSILLPSFCIVHNGLKTFLSLMSLRRDKRSF